MNKAEYKRLSHKIREMCYSMSRQHKELTRQNYTSRAYMHNMLLWFDGLNADKFGHYHYTYSCIGDHDTGLVWDRTFFR